MGLKLRRLHTLTEFASLRDPWNDLVAHTDANDVWMTHEWFRAWIQHFGDPAHLAVVTGWRDGQLVAAAPMHIVREKRHGLPFRVLTFLSSGVFPRCTFLVESERDAAEFFDGILGLGGWDVMGTDDLEEGRATTSWWGDYLAARRPSAHRVTPGRMVPFISTDLGWDAYWASLGKSFRAHLRQGLRRLDKAESVAFSRIDQYPAFASAFPELIEASARSWKGSQSTDLKSRANLQAFLLEFSASMVDPSPFEAHILRINGQVAAFDYYVRSRNTLTLMRTDFDVDFKYYNPGHGLRHHVLTDLFARDEAWEYDMGGQARGYKLDWTNQSRRHLTFTVGRGLYGRLVLFLKHSEFARRLATRKQGETARPGGADRGEAGDSSPGDIVAEPITRGGTRSC